MQAALADYAQAIDYLYRHTDYERMARVRHHAGSYDLERVKRLCDALGRPQDAFASLHVAGTKGKGSVTALAAWMLAGGGLTVGQYTSPHLTDLRERIVTIRPGEGGPPAAVPIGPDAFTAALNRILPAASAVPDDPPTFFELVTMIALVDFSSGAPPVDVAVLETGLGGRLDATNVVTPQAVALTPIDIEHTRQLGATLEQIAAEKAGVIKPGVPVISAPQQPAAAAVIARTARDRLAPLWFVGREVRLERRLLDAVGGVRRWEATVTTPNARYGPMTVPLLGRHQTVNLAVAVALVDRLAEVGWKVDGDGLIDGLARAEWPGRLDIRGRRPWLVFDGAHTVDSLRTVLEVLPQTLDYRRLIGVMSCVSDKDLAGLVGQLGSAADALVLTRSDHPHGVAPQTLARLAARLAPNAARHVEHDADKALQRALSLAGPDDLVLVTGSIYLVGLLMRPGGRISGP